jgi:hypothetical protein
VAIYIKLGILESFKKDNFNSLLDNFNSLIVPKSSKESENEFSAEKKPETITNESDSEKIFLAIEKFLNNSGKPSLIIKKSCIIN